MIVEVLCDIGQDSRKHENFKYQACKQPILLCPNGINATA